MIVHRDNWCARCQVFRLHTIDALGIPTCPEKPIRITIDLNPKFYERLEHIEHLVSAVSKAEVAREALRIYEYLMTQASQGAQFQILEKGSDKPKGIVMFTDVDAS